MESNNIIITRPPTPEDINFILNSWLKSNRYRIKNIDNNTYYTLYKNHIIKLLQSSEVLIAVNQEDPTQILGYLVVEDNTCNYVYVKYCYRKLGIVKLLRQQLPFEYQSVDPKQLNYRNINLLKGA